MKKVRRRRGLPATLIPDLPERDLFYKSAITYFKNYGYIVDSHIANKITGNNYVGTAWGTMSIEELYKKMEVNINNKRDLSYVIETIRNIGLDP